MNNLHKHVENQDTGIIGIKRNSKKINELVDAVNSLEANVADHENLLGQVVDKIRFMWGRRLFGGD